MRTELTLHDSDDAPDAVAGRSGNVIENISELVRTQLTLHNNVNITKNVVGSSGNVRMIDSGFRSASTSTSADNINSRSDRSSSADSFTRLVEWYDSTSSGSFRKLAEWYPSLGVDYPEQDKENMCPCRRHRYVTKQRRNWNWNSGELEFCASVRFGG
jgi:hypothetical protein